MQATEYNLITGVMGAQVYKSDEQPYTPESGNGSVDGMYDGNFYYVDVSTNPVTVMDRSALVLSINKTEITADGIDEAIISNVPVDSHCRIIKQHETILDSDIIDGTVELSTAQTGYYTITITHPEYIKQVIEVTAI